MNPCSKLNVIIAGDIERLRLLRNKQTTEALMFTFDEETKEIMIQASEFATPVQYGFFYTGVQRVLASTPLSITVQSSIVASLASGKGSILYGEVGTRKQELLRSLAQKLGYPGIVMSCSDQEDAESLRSLISAALKTGAWIILDGFHRVKYCDDLRDLIAFELRRVQEDLVDSRKVLCLGNEEFGVNQGRVGEIFMTLNAGSMKGSSIWRLLNENIDLFNTAALELPDIQLILEVTVARAGFLDWVNVARLIAEVQKFCQRHLSIQSFYNFDLRGMKKIVELLRQRGSELLQTPVSQALVVKEILSHLSISLVEADRKLLKFFLELLVSVELESPLAKETEMVKQALPSTDIERCRLIAAFVDQLQVSRGILLVGGEDEKRFALVNSAFQFRVSNEQQVNLVVIEVEGKDQLDLYGRFGENNQFIDGPITEAMRNQENSQGETWILIKGQITASQVQLLNDVIEGEKKLALATGEKIPLNDHTRIIFDTQTVDDFCPSLMTKVSVIPVGTVSQMHAIEVSNDTQIDQYNQPVFILGGVQSITQNLLDQQMLGYLKSSISKEALAELYHKKWAEVKKRIECFKPTLDGLLENSKGKVKKIVALNITIWNRLIEDLDWQLGGTGSLDLKSLERRLKGILGARGVVMLDSLVILM